MPRLLSVALTEQAVVERRKTVTRRVGWWTTKTGARLLLPGDHLVLCRKVMGRKAGEPLVRLCEVEAVDVRREYLRDVTDSDVCREGFRAEDLTEYGIDPRHIGPGELAAAFIAFFTAHMGGGEHQEVTRIEWRYLEPA